MTPAHLGPLRVSLMCLTDTQELSYSQARGTPSSFRETRTGRQDRKEGLAFAQSTIQEPTCLPHPEEIRQAECGKKMPAHHFPTTDIHDLT